MQLTLLLRRQDNKLPLLCTCRNSALGTIKLANKSQQVYFLHQNFYSPCSMMDFPYLLSPSHPSSHSRKLCSNSTALETLLPLCQKSLSSKQVDAINLLRYQRDEGKCIKGCERWATVSRSAGHFLLLFMLKTLFIFPSSGLSWVHPINEIAFMRFSH